MHITCPTCFIVVDIGEYEEEKGLKTFRYIEGQYMPCPLCKTAIRKDGDYEGGTRTIEKLEEESAYYSKQYDS